MLQCWTVYFPVELPEFGIWRLNSCCHHLLCVHSAIVHVVIDAYFTRTLADVAFLDHHWIQAVVAVVGAGLVVGGRAFVLQWLCVCL